MIEGGGGSLEGPLHRIEPRTVTPGDAAHAATKLMPRIIGLTGGIASGKSTVSRCWVKAGVPVIDADKVAREVVAPGGPALRLIRWRFGRGVINPNGSLNRAALGQIIFSNPSMRRRLDVIMHPFIIASMVRQLVLSLFVRFESVVVLDTPLLYESKTLLPFCNATVVVACTEEQQLERLLLRSQADARVGIGTALTEEQARSRIAAQIPLHQKVARAQHVLNNSLSQSDLERDALELLSRLRPSPAGELAFRALVLGSALKLMTTLVGGLSRKL